MKKVIHVIGARPNFIKASPLIKKMDELNIENIVLHTGQHYDHNMSQQFFDEMDIRKPDYNLEVQGGSNAYQIGNVMIGCEKIFKEINPDLVIVYGDVNGCLAASMVAYQMNIRLAHVESGLRSRDRNMPEEFNRTITDRLSDIHFVTCEDAIMNLKFEGLYNRKSCHFVGNTMIDSLVEFTTKFNKSKIMRKLKLENEEYALITLHRPSNVDNKKDLQKMMDSIVKVSKKTKCIFPIHPRTKNNLNKFNLYEKYNKIKTLYILEPLGYIDFMFLQKNAKFVITDSGGVQEESSFFNVPCLTLRENTERPVTTSSGTNSLIGCNYEDLSKHVDNINYNRKFKIQHWDGKASDRMMFPIKKELGLITTPTNIRKRFGL